MEHELVTSEDHVTLVQIWIWLLFIFAVLTVIARTSIKFTFSKSIFGFDDWAIHTAAIFALGQSVSVYLATAHGLGKSQDPSGQDEFQSLEKARYAASILFNFAFCSARLSILGLLRLIRPAKSDDRLIYGFGGLICLWTLVSVIISAIQCHPPQTWDVLRGQCIDQISWLLAMDVVNIVIDILLIILPLTIIWKVQVKISKRLSLMFFFGVRITVIAALICDAAFVSELGASDDVMRDAWRSVISMQFVQSLSIMTACTLYLKPFLETLQSGFIRGDDLRRRDPSLAGYASYNMSNPSKNPSRRRKSSAADFMSAAKQPFGNINKITRHDFMPSDQAEKGNGDQVNQPNAIVADTTITVEYERREDNSAVGTSSANAS